MKSRKKQIEELSKEERDRIVKPFLEKIIAQQNPAGTSINEAMNEGALVAYTAHKHRNILGLGDYLMSLLEKLSDHEWKGGNPKQFVESYDKMASVMVEIESLERRASRRSR